MFEKLKELNSGIGFYNVSDKEFLYFGRVINDLDVTEIIESAKIIQSPENGSAYIASLESFEALKIAKEIKNEFFGSLPTQIGYCYGHNNFLNAAEWHTSSEINIAVTPLVLILGHIWDIKEGQIDSSKFSAFYLPAGSAVEVFSTSLHFCPCEVDTNGFGCVVALPRGTNTDLEIVPENKMLFRKNKWIIAHNNNTALIAKGIPAGISGENFKINY